MAARDGASDTSGPAPEAGTEGDTRERLMRAAVEVFFEKGYGGTRVQDIARRAGFTSGALYVHFQNRTALLTEALANELRTMLVTAAELAAELPADMEHRDPAAAIPVEDQTAVDLLVIEGIALVARDAEARSAVQGDLVGYLDALTAAVGRLQDEGIIDPVLDPLLVAHHFLGREVWSMVVRSLDLPLPAGSEATSVARRIDDSLAPPTS